MENKNEIKLIKYKKLLDQDIVLIGESIDWRAMGSKLKRDILKKKGIGITLMKKSYMRYFYKELNLFKGNIIVVSLKQGIKSKDLLVSINEIEKELGILPLFLINKKRVMGISYLKSLIKEDITKESISSVLIKSIKMPINQLNESNKRVIKVLGKIK